MLEGLTWRAVGGMLLRYWHFLAIGLLLGITVAQHLSLRGEADFRRHMQSVLSAASDSHEALLDKGATVSRENGERRQALETINRDTQAARSRADAADARLRDEQAANQRRFAAYERRITDLQSRRPTGNAEQDLHIIEQDSEAAWRGWR